MKKFLGIVGAVLMVLGIGLYLANQDSKPVKTNDFSSVPRDNQLLNNMHKAGLDALSAEGTVLHIHQHVDIVVDGKPVSLPGQVGIGSSFISPLHTHDTTGIIHVESPTKKDFTLGQFFDEWGVDLNNQCIANNCAGNDKKLLMFVNGQKTDEIPKHVLGAHEEIYLWFGSKDQNPQPIKAFTFPEGY
ncbi:MAG: hypothetical protein NVSMB66_3790 [Candidatus Doudnabacteria bacterium]